MRSIINALALACYCVREDLKKVIENMFAGETIEAYKQDLMHEIKNSRRAYKGWNDALEDLENLQADCVALEVRLYELEEENRRLRVLNEQ